MPVTDQMRDPYPTILHLIPILAVGGTEHQLLGFIERSGAPERHHIAVFHEPGELAHRAPNPPIVLGRIGRHVADIRTDLSTLSMFRRTVRSIRPDLVHTHLELSELVAAAATPPGVPIVASKRGDVSRYRMNQLFKMAEGAAHRRIRVLICNSEHLASRARAHDGFPAPIRVIHNGVDLERFAVAPVAEGVPEVAVVANLHPHKGHERLLRALRLVRLQRPDARMTFVGDGVERARLEGLSAELGLSDAVTFTGLVDDPRPHIRAAQVVALASDDEGFPNALLEAMAMGRPVVATRVGGIPELVRDEQDGFLTTLEPEDIAARLLELLRDLELRRRIGTSARARAEAFTWDRVVEQTERVYREVLATTHT